MLAARGDNLRAATPAQVKAIVIGLDQLSVPVLGKLPGKQRRAWRITFLDDIFGTTDYPTVRYGTPVTSAKDLSFSEASSLIEWLRGDRAYGDLCVWEDGRGTS